MIALEHIDFGYGKAPLLHDLTCSLRDGEITALIGPNGAGKSTVLRLCARMLRPQAGEILVDGRPAHSYDSRAFARTLAFLPQTRPTPMISVRSLVMHGRFAHLPATRKPTEADHEAVRRALDRTGLRALADRTLTTLSGGQRQMAYIAMLIAQEARHILLDEPLTFLDVGVQLDLMDILRTLRDEGRCIALVVHDLSLVPQLCGRVLVLHEGRLLYDGPALDADSIKRAFHVQPVWREGLTFEKI